MALKNVKFVTSAAEKSQWIKDDKKEFVLLGRSNVGKSTFINLITNVRGNFYLWGNRTAEALREDGLVASHFLNIRQLCSTIKKQVYVACRKFTFDPNSDVLWINLCNAITPMLERMKANQGIEDYIIEQVETTEKAKKATRSRRPNRNTQKKPRTTKKTTKKKEEN